MSRLALARRLNGENTWLRWGLYTATELPLRGRRSVWRRMSNLFWRVVCSALWWGSAQRCPLSGVKRTLDRVIVLRLTLSRLALCADRAPPRLWTAPMPCLLRVRHRRL